MRCSIGLRREDKNEWERRVPLAPHHVKTLVDQGIEVLVQPSRIRIFSDEEYKKAGALISEDLSVCGIVFGVKEIPHHYFLKDHVYLFFTHAIKGQPHNMAMLQKALDTHAVLLDYEKVTDQQQKRLIFFGRHAGQAGMTDTLCAFGKRLHTESIDTPFLKLQQTYTYKNLSAIQDIMQTIAQEISLHGLPQHISPVVIGFAGYGNVSAGAQDIFDILPHVSVSPDDLNKTVQQWDPTDHRLIKVVFKEQNTIRPKNPQNTFDRADFIAHPDHYETNFTQYLPSLSILINAIFWLPGHPRLITKKEIQQLYALPSLPRLQIIGDISCDIAGAIEFTTKSTTPSDPFFVYQVETDSITPGYHGKGPAILAVDNLPCELSEDASQFFGDCLTPFIPTIVAADYTVSFDQLSLPQSLKQAIITYQGTLTPSFEYLYTFLQKTPKDIL